ncbi:response regulator [Dongia soli]|uniref:Response regulator n=1 Tax=Dongia soli TaxID=600628 RepID=A0ABU5EH70_9PROT|nr:response regulator [Dongia soli]MDY0885778.1 response regulator [Dongia soli]
MSGAKRTKVLVVEDELLVRIGVRDLIDDCGYEPIEAAHAAEALSILERDTEIKIVIADIAIPCPIGGLTLAKTIRSKWPPIDLIITSGKIEPTADDLPARAKFLPKPFTAGDLSAVLHGFSGPAS